MAAIGVFTKRGKQKRAAADLEQKFEFATNDVLREVTADRLSPVDGVAAMEAILNEGIQTFRGARRELGVASDRAIQNMTKVINANIAAAKAHQPPVVSRLTSGLKALDPKLLVIGAPLLLLFLGRLFR